MSTRDWFASLSISSVTLEELDKVFTRAHFCSLFFNVEHPMFDAEGDFDGDSQ
jgi:hypothetical protein